MDEQFSISFEHISFRVVSISNETRGCHRFTAFDYFGRGLIRKSLTLSNEGHLLDK